MPVVWAVTLGWDHRACRVKLNLQVPASCISAHRLLQQNVQAEALWTSSLPKLQIQTSQTDLSSSKSLYIPTLTLRRQQQFQSCFLGELLTSSEPGSAPGVASFCWFVQDSQKELGGTGLVPPQCRCRPGGVGNAARKNKQEPGRTGLSSWNPVSCFPTQATDTGLGSLDRPWNLENWNIRKKNG